MITKMSDEDAAKVTALQTEYFDLAHAVQSGVAMEWEMGSKDTQPKHLRVGVNSAIIQNSAIATLLMHKGIITEVEYWETLVELWRTEVRAYEERISANLGKTVTLK